MAFDEMTLDKMAMDEMTVGKMSVVEMTVDKMAWRPINPALPLLQVMKEFNVKRIVFSSSSTVFGDPEYLPIDEKHPTGNCSNPYGRTKYFIEEFIKDVCKSDQVSSLPSKIS
jgi:UDP-glucose 4-epimerase